MSFVNSDVKSRLNSRNPSRKTMSCFAFKSRNSCSKVIRKQRGRGLESSSSSCWASRSSPHATFNHASLMMVMMLNKISMTWPSKELNRVVRTAAIIQSARCHLKIAATPALWWSTREILPPPTSMKISLGIM